MRNLKLSKNNYYDAQRTLPSPGKEYHAVAMLYISIVSLYFLLRPYSKLAGSEAISMHDWVYTLRTIATHYTLPGKLI